MASLPEFPRRFYNKGFEPYPVKSINHYSCNSDLITAMTEGLEDDEWTEISDSSLGVFAKFIDLGFGWASRLVHVMLGFQIECLKKYEIWSLVGVNPLRFSLHEFQSITGLNCGVIEDVDEEVELTEEMQEFWEKMGVAVNSGPSTKELTSAWAKSAEWSREERLRLGYLSIYAGFIEARKTSSPTCLHLARLVMDLDAFLAFPWGRYTFQNVMRSVKSVDLNKSYTLEGFAEVLQVWAYEAMPDYAIEFANPVPVGRGVHLTPLIAYGGSRGRRNVQTSMLKQVNS